MASVRIAQQNRLFLDQWRKLGSPEGRYVPALNDGGLKSGYTYDPVRDVVIDDDGNVQNANSDAFNYANFRYIPAGQRNTRRPSSAGILHDQADMSIYVEADMLTTLKEAWRIFIQNKRFVFAGETVSLDGAPVRIELREA